MRAMRSCNMEREPRYISPDSATTISLAQGLWWTTTIFSKSYKRKLLAIAQTLDSRIRLGPRHASFDPYRLVQPGSCNAYGFISSQNWASHHSMFFSIGLGSILLSGQPCGAPIGCAGTSRKAFRAFSVCTTEAAFELLRRHLQPVRTRPTYPA